MVAAALSAIGLFTATPAHAQEYVYHPAPRIVRTYRAPGYAPYWRLGHRMGWRFYLRPSAETPVYSYAQPEAPRAYGVYDGGGAFAEHIRDEIASVEAAVRDRVATGELDGSALSAMESSRDDIEQDIVDVSAKGYLTAADRAHLEDDVHRLRERFGC